MPLEIVRNDITSMKVDAIVNSANPRPVIGGGVDAAIHAAAGRKLLEARRRIGEIAVGDAAITRGGRLASRYVIHTVGPLWKGGASNEAHRLGLCYSRSLDLARRKRCRSVAFPLVSTGAYGFPKDLALRVAIDSIGAFLQEHEMLVYLVVYDRRSYELSEKLFGKIQAFIEGNYVESRRCDDDGRSSLLPDEVPDERALGKPEPCPGFGAGASSGGLPQCSQSLRSCAGAALESPAHVSQPSAAVPGACAPVAGASPRARRWEGRKLEDVLGEVEETFSESLLRLIDERGIPDPQVYKRANLDRKLFSKMRSNKHYQPSKRTALALAVALELSLDETRDFIGRAGYLLTHSSKADLIVEYFIVNGEYDIFKINEALFAFDQPLIGR